MKSKKAELIETKGRMVVARGLVGRKQGVGQRVQIYSYNE